MERRDGASLLHPGQIANENRQSFDFLKEVVVENLDKPRIIECGVGGWQGKMTRKKAAGSGGSSRRLDSGIVAGEAGLLAGSLPPLKADAGA
jgi:hypothetical protein